jgi:predicted  nucleic acid-binding Zn-ribbon protein
MTEEDIQELQAYLERVQKELHRRETALYQVMQVIVKIEQKLASLSSHRSLLRGNALGVVATERYRTKLRYDLAIRQNERAVAAEDVERARDRKDVVEQELAEALSSVDTTRT